MITTERRTFTYKNISDRKRKNLAILDCIRRKVEISRSDIAKETGINIVSVSNYIMNYLKKGLVVECGRDISTGGRRPELVRLNLESAYVAGLDIGSEELTAVVSDLALKTKAKATARRPEGHMDTIIDCALGLLADVFNKFGKPLTDIKLIGIGASGVIDVFSGTIHDTDPRRGRSKASLLALVRSLEEKFNIPSRFGNDATCGAFGELSLNPDMDINDMLYVYSDIGCGIIINRDIYCGASGSAGEIQLLRANKELGEEAVLEIGSYGIKGIDLGVVAKARELIEKGEKTNIVKIAGSEAAVTKETIVDAAQKGDKLARELMIDAANWLGVKVSYLVNIFNPQLVVIGGGMEKAGSVFMDTLTSCVKMHSFEEAFMATKILPSFLGKEAIAIGAASLSVRELFVNT